LERKMVKGIGEKDRKRDWREGKEIDWKEGL
jgi:hypothetical protein